MTLLKDNTQDHEGKWSPQCKKRETTIYINSYQDFCSDPVLQSEVECSSFIFLSIFSWVGPLGPTSSVVVQDHNFDYFSSVRFGFDVG